MLPGLEPTSAADAKISNENYNHPIHILIIGLGNVAFRFNLDSGDLTLKTHAISLAQFSATYDVEVILHGVDPLAIRRNEFQKLLGFHEINTYAEIAGIPKLDFDLVLICSPIKQLIGSLINVINSVKFKKIVLEKPGASNSDEICRFNELVIPFNSLVLGYPRRSLPTIKKIRDYLQSFSSSTWTIKISFSGEPINIFSHFLDMIEFFFGSFVVKTSHICDELLIIKGFNSNNNATTFIAEQTAFNNQHDHVIKFDGPISFIYDESTGILNDTENRFNILFGSRSFKFELANMIGYECFEYMNWLLMGCDTGLASEFSTGFKTLLNVLEGDFNE